MKFQLVMKNTREVVTVTDREVFGLNEAKAYYVRMKQLKEKEFDKLYVVEEYQPPKGVYSQVERLRVRGGDRGRNWNDYKWWKDESTKMDIEKE